MIYIVDSRIFEYEHCVMNMIILEINYVAGMQRSRKIKLKYTHSKKKVGGKIPGIVPKFFKRLNKFSIRISDY